MSFQHEYPYGDVHELNLDWIIQTMQEFINSERQAGNTPTVSSVRSFFTHKYPYGDIHELNLDWVIQTALRMEEIGDSVEGDIGELQTRMTAAEGNISELDNTVSGLSDSIGQIETEIEDIQGDVEDLQTTAAQHTAQIAALDQKIDTQVVGNPAEAATDTLSKIEIAGTVYTVEGSGGSEVKANPAGEPTDTLQKIGIDGTIYEVGGSKPVSKTVTGNPIHIEDAADAPFVSGEVSFAPKQDLHGYDKPWAGGAGKNKLEVTGSSTTVSGVTFTVNSDGTILVNGTATADIQYNVISNWSAFPAGNYILNGCPSGLSNMNLYVNPDRTQPYYDNGSGVSFSVTSEIIVRIYMASGVTANNILFKPMIRLATETDPTFEPYSNICPIEGYTDCELEVTDDATSPTVTNTYTIDLDGTRYGGKVNTVSGQTLVNMINVDLGDLTWEMRSDSAGNYFRATLSPSAKPKTLSDLGNNLCSVYPISASSAVIDKSLAVGNTGNVVYIRDTDYPDAATFKTAMSGVQLVYELATPFTAQLTPEQIRTLEGTNNISTNMTGMTLEYITQEYQPLVKLIERSAGHHYSTQERVVGTWIDGKTLYEKSWNVSIALPSESANTWVSTGIEITSVNCDGIVGGEMIDDQNQCIAGSIGFIQQKTYFAIYSQIGGRTITKVTIRYTKTTD